MFNTPYAQNGIELHYDIFDCAYNRKKITQTQFQF